VKVKTIYYFTNYIIVVMKADIFARIAIEKVLKRPKMRFFEGARRRREKNWGILSVWEKKLITLPPLVNRRSETRGVKL